MIYIQAKRLDIDRTIGRLEIQRFIGALAGQGVSTISVYPIKKLDSNFFENI